MKGEAAQITSLTKGDSSACRVPSGLERFVQSPPRGDLKYSVLCRTGPFTSLIKGRIAFGINHANFTSLLNVNCQNLDN